MFKKNNFFVISNLKIHLKRYKSALIYPFMIGLVMGSIPFIYESKENFRINQLIREQRKIKIQNKQKICKQENSDYEKFLNLGFPKTAIEKYNICMESK